MAIRACSLLSLAVAASAHSSLIYPKPRNAIDSSLPEWSGGRAPYRWEKVNDPPWADYPCACKNGTEPCESAQTCLWFSVGCTIGCAECDGGSQGGSNPNRKDRCGSGKKATNNDPEFRTINRQAAPFSDDDWTRFNPWRAPGSAPVFDACGRAGGAPGPTPGHGEFTNTTFAKFGDLGSQVLPKMFSGAVWPQGSVQTTLWAARTNHGGGYQYRLCPLKAQLTEACFHQTPVPFAGDSSLMLSNGTKIGLKSTFLSTGTLPAGSTWQTLPIPATYNEFANGSHANAFQFPPPCYEPSLPTGLNTGRCSGEWSPNVTIYDQLRVPQHLEPGEYVLGLRYDCEASAQVWNSCADIVITHAAAGATALGL